MNNYDYNFYDLLSYGLGGTKDYQVYVDTFLKDTQDKFETSGFSFEPDLLSDFTFNHIEASLSMATMATYVDLYSPAPMKHGEGFESFTGNVPRMKHGYPINEDVLRKEMLLMQQTNSFSTTMPDRMFDVLFDNTKKLIDGNYNSLTYQRNQLISKGQFATNSTNNPDGIKSFSFSARIPASNVTTLTTTARWFTDSTNTEGSASDPIADLKAMVQKLEDLGVDSIHFEVDKKSYERALNHSKVKEAIGVYLYPLSASANIGASVINLNKEAKKAALEGILGCPITLINSIVSVESFDASKGKVVPVQMRSFAADTWVLVPDGSLGVIKSVMPIANYSPATRVALFDGGRTLLKQWWDDRTATQYIESEHTSLVVPDKPKYIFRLVTA